MSGTSSIVNSLNSKMRISGMASGLDTDTIIKQLMAVETAKVDKVKQQRDLLEWKRDDYRSIASTLKGFYSDFMDVAKPASNMKSANNYKIYQATVSGDTVTASANSAAMAGTYKITVDQLATAAHTDNATTAVATKPLDSNISDYNFTANKDFNVNLNGVTRKITIAAGDYSGANFDNLVSALQTSIDTAFGTVPPGGDKRITVAKVVDGGGNNQLRFSSTDGRATLTTGTNVGLNALTQLGITSGSSNRLNLSNRLNETNLAKSLAGTLNFTINGTAFSFDTAQKSMSDVINDINSSSAGVFLSYSEVTDKFTLTSKTTGAGVPVNVTDTAAGFFNAIGIVDAVTTSFSVSGGQDAKFDLETNGIKTDDIIRSSNSFTLDGISYSLIKTGAEATVTLTPDVDTAYGKIKAFVDKYNEVIDKINGEYEEKKYRDYAPLTDDQRESLSEDEIEKWEEKAKSGMLKSDSILSDIVGKMRRALFDSFSADSGITGNISDIGISTGSYLDKGKLFIDETKLKNAIANTPDKIMNLFMKEPSVSYSPNLTEEERTTRYNNSGIIQRLSDIIQDNIHTSRDNNNKKGILLEKAGIIGDITEYKNLINDQISDKDKLIDQLLDRLSDKEESYYRKFSALETAMNRMNSQSEWMAQQFGSSQ